MKELLEVVTEFVVPAIDLMALLLIVVGTIEAFVLCVKGIFVRTDAHARRNALIGYGRWLVAGLTFQLAADILETSIRTSWEAIGQLAAIAVIRTFLNYFLEKDLAEAREQENEAA
jgi:uncharacterized membrane protein